MGISWQQAIETPLDVVFEHFQYDEIEIKLAQIKRKNNAKPR